MLLTEFFKIPNTEIGHVLSWSPSIISLQETLSIRAFAIRLSGQRNKIQLQKHSHQETGKKNWKIFHLIYCAELFNKTFIYKSTIEFTFSSIRSFKVVEIQYILLQKIVDIEIYLQNRGASASKSF